MPIEFAEQNVVIAAHQLNPSIFRESWLLAKGLIDSPADLLEGSVYTPQFVLAKTSDFELLIVPDRLQWTPKGDDLDRRDQVAVKKIAMILQALAETPYTAIGLNFAYWVTVKEDFSSFCRRLFFNDSPLAHAFDVSDAHFGGYFSKDFQCLRMKLDVKPNVKRKLDLSTGKRVQVEGEYLAFNFNFHRDLDPGDQVTEAIEALGLLPTARSQSHDIVIQQVDE